MPREEDERHSIRISVSGDEETLHLIVSDTGTGFEHPGRAFDAFYTTSDHPAEGAGLGLSICFGIVREHAGRISPSTYTRMEPPSWSSSRFILGRSCRPPNRQSAASPRCRPASGRRPKAHAHAAKTIARNSSE